ncbi:MAG: HlyD family efflux transporter periplasmic adaptor subunit [Bacteroidales bacterium]|nr:HlyD family efflux transporter periplasmic adaptor subunit [Bacteroidales bacterium]
MTEEEHRPEIELKSEEVKEILGQIPHWIIRWGTILVFTFILMIFLGSWWFKYPDMVDASIVVTTENPPSNAVAHTSGKIMKLMVSDNEEVRAGQLLALIENPGNLDDIIRLRDELNTFQNQFESVKAGKSEFFRENFVLGDIQPLYANFLKQYNDYCQFLELDYYQQKVKSLNEEIGKYRDYSKRLTKQSMILKQEEELAARQFTRDSLVYRQGVIPESDYEKSKTFLLQKQYAYEQSRITLASNEIQISQLSQQVLDLELRASEEAGKNRSGLNEAANKLVAGIADWEQKYVLKSTVNGIVSFTRIWSQNQDVEEGSLVMSVIPKQPGEIIGKLNLPLSGAGKVKVGQNVNIKFASYPYMEYGMVKGRVKGISLVASDNQYSVIVELPEGLKTGYGTELEFKQDMQGVAEIITNDRRLLERIILPLRAVFARQKQISENQK